jgi:phosphoglycolate phosphatase
MTRLVIFDLDGTLIDSRRDLADSANDMLASYGAAPLSEHAIGSMVGSGAAQLVARAVVAAGIDAPLDEALERFLTSYDSRLTHHTRPYAGVPELLSQLSAEQITMALLTNKPLAASERILDVFGLAEHFRWCVGGDGPWPRKPSPDGLQFLAREAGVQPDKTVLVGDSSVDLLTARNAGAAICLARYGFGFEELSPDLLRGDEWMVDHPREIAEVVRR